MTELANLQARFQDHVVNGTAANVEVFVGDQKASAAERARVYYDAYRLRLAEILRVDFPGLCALMTTDEFDALARRYLDAHPSRYPTVRWFGQHLADFLAADGLGAERGYLPEMAAFEWARGRAFDAADAELLSASDLAAVPAGNWPFLRINFHPSLQRCQSDWNVGPIWRAINAGEPVPEPARLGEPLQLMLWRTDLVIYWRSVDAAEAWARDAFSNGRSFADVCDGLCDFLDADEVPVAAAGMLRQWVAEGLITKIRTQQD
jgi:hypothetical protein